MKQLFIAAALLVVAVFAQTQSSNICRTTPNGDVASAAFPEGTVFGPLPNCTMFTCRCSTAGTTQITCTWVSSLSTNCVPPTTLPPGTTAPPPTECVDFSGNSHRIGTTWNEGNCITCECIQTTLGATKNCFSNGQCSLQCPLPTSVFSAGGSLGDGQTVDRDCYRYLCRCITTATAGVQCSLTRELIAGCVPPTTTPGPTQPRKYCVRDGREYDILATVNFPCETCTCVESPNFSTGGFLQCTPIVYATTGLTPTGCPTLPPPPTQTVRCYFNGQVYNVGDVVPTANTACTRCVCNANGGIDCATATNCGTTSAPPSCSYAGVTIAQGTSHFFEPCQECFCGLICNGDATLTTTACRLGVTCRDRPDCTLPTTSAPTGTRPTPTFVCFDDQQNGYLEGQLWYQPATCTVARCTVANGWVYSQVTTAGCGNNDPAPQPCVRGTSTFQVGETFVVDCMQCRCEGITRATASLSGLAASGFNCTRLPTCATNTPSQGATNPTGTRYCTDDAGRIFFPGDVVPSRDGCRLCICRYKTSTATSPEFDCDIAVTNTASTAANSLTTCCALDGVVYPSSTNQIVDRTNRRICTCNLGVLACQNATVVSCDFNGQKYPVGSVRPAPNSACRPCECDPSGNWQCPTETECPRRCATIRFTITVTNPPAVIDQAKAQAFLDAQFGAGKATIVDFSSTPNELRVVIEVTCIDISDADVDAAADRIAQALSKRFGLNVDVTGNTDSQGGSYDGATTTYAIVDPGTVDSTPVPTDDAQSLAASALLVLVALLAVLA